MTTPAELVREACDLLAGYLPELAALTPEPDESAYAAPGMTGRPPSAPLPGNAQALFALTAIHATARQLEGVLLYAAGARRPGLLAVRGDSDANTVKALDAICRLFAAVEGDRDLEYLVMAELDARLNDARSLPAIDPSGLGDHEPQKWRHLRGRACHYCGCYFLKVLLDRDDNATRHVECFGHDETRAPCRAVAAADADDHGRVGLRWADGTFETMPDLDAA